MKNVHLFVYRFFVASFEMSNEFVLFASFISNNINFSIARCHETSQNHGFLIRGLIFSTPG